MGNHTLGKATVAMKNCPDRKVEGCDFWTCWYALHADGWHHFFWEKRPNLVLISLYNRWYKKEDLLSFFFQKLFSARRGVDCSASDFIFDCVMECLDAMKPFDDLLSDAFLSLSPKSFLRTVKSLYRHSGPDIQPANFFDGTAVFLALFSVWPLSLGESYKRTLLRLALITNKIA